MPLMQIPLMQIPLMQIPLMNVFPYRNRVLAKP
jgi:hypothetical protein